MQKIIIKDSELKDLENKSVDELKELAAYYEQNKKTLCDEANDRFNSNPLVITKQSNFASNLVDSWITQTLLPKIYQLIGEKECKK